MRHATPHTRSRCERLTDRTANGPVAVVLLATLPLALVHPVAFAVGALLVTAHWFSRRSQ